MSSSSRKRDQEPRPAEILSGFERLSRKLSARRVPNEEEYFAGIAAQVVERRKAWGLSQSDLARLCNTTQSAIARLERGLRPPRVDTLLRIASVLDCELKVELRPRP